MPGGTRDGTHRGRARPRASRSARRRPSRLPRFPHPRDRARPERRFQGGHARCRARASRARRSSRELLRLAAMLLRDLPLVGLHQPPLAYDVLAGHHELIDAVRPAEYQSSDRVFGAAELEPVGPPDREIRAAARLERAEIFTGEHPRATASAEPQRLARRQCLRAAAPACDEERLLDLEEEVAALVRGRAVDAESHPNARVEQAAHRRNTGSEPQVRGGAVRDARARFREPRDVAVVEVDAVRAPDVSVEPAELLEVLDRSAAVQLLAVRLLLDGLG